MRKAIEDPTDREGAVIGLPHDKILRGSFGRAESDYSHEHAEFEHMLFPLHAMFEDRKWSRAFDRYYDDRADGREAKDVLDRFLDEVVSAFANYQIPVITLTRDTSKEAVCLVFEKVNTGGKPLDAFELVTATYAADGYELRKDWYGTANVQGRQQRLASALASGHRRYGILEKVANTEFLQAVSLFHTRDQRRLALKEGKRGKELPPINANRAALLQLPLGAYEHYQAQVEDGFVRAAKFLNMLHIFRAFDLPYQSQLVPLAAILADLGDAFDNESVRASLRRWYWCGVFGELYGAATETRIARDFAEVPSWARGEAATVPSTIEEATFRSDRLDTMRMRISAAYKGVNALLMAGGARDFLSGQHYEHTNFFGEDVDIHHVFPRAWCDKNGIVRARSDAIVNKTPLQSRTNRILGGRAPSAYLKRLEEGTKEHAPIWRADLSAFLRTHLLDPEALLRDDFKTFYEDRRERLLLAIEDAMGKPAFRNAPVEEGEDVQDDVGDEQAPVALVA